MEKIIKGFVLVGIIVAITFLMPGFMDNTNYTKADEAEWSETGSEEDAFTILEIVPYKGMGEIGYLVGGQEPVEKELMSFSTATNDLSFLGGAISVYPSYVDSPIPGTGMDSGWKLARTYITEDGYYEEVDQGDGNALQWRTHTVYERVPDGTGAYEARLANGTRLSDTYRGVNQPINRKNVNSYFAYENTLGVTFFNVNAGYEVYSVTAIPDNTGDYDYDSETKIFILNIGNGAYDVIFDTTNNTTNVYHMTIDYEIVEDRSGEYSVEPGAITYVSQAGGNYNRFTRNAYYPQSGQYTNSQWVSAEMPEGVANYSVDADGKTWVRGSGGEQLEDFQYFENVELVNNEWFRRMCLGVPSSQVKNSHVRVVTITPEELNMPENQHYIAEAGLFYINTNYTHNTNYMKLYETYNADGLNPSNPKYANATATVKQNNLNFAIHDLNWTNVESIFKKVAGIGCGKAGLLIDSTFYKEATDGTGAYAPYLRTVSIQGETNRSNRNGATSCNIAKLYIMVYQRNMIDFYNSFMNPITTNDMINMVTVGSGVNSSLSSGSFIRPYDNASWDSDIAMYWNGNTFLWYGLNDSGQMTTYNANQAIAEGIFNSVLIPPDTSPIILTDLTYNVLTIGGNDTLNRGILDSRFIQHLNIPADSQPYAIAHLTSINPSGTLITESQITIAGLVNVILNNGLGYENTGGVAYPDGGIVEGEDAEVIEDPDDAEEDGTDGSNARKFKRVLYIQPTADFNSTDFINAENDIRAFLSDYDVQIVKMSCAQFNASIEDINTRYDVIYMGSLVGRFNNNGTRSNFYNITDGNIYFPAGDRVSVIEYGRTVYYRYTANDITVQKKKELENFLSAGYPFVLDNNLYTLPTTLPYVQNTTNMYSFINQSKSYAAKFLNLNNFKSTNTTTKNTFIARLKGCLNVKRPILKLIEPILAEDTTVNYTYVDPDTKLLTIRFSLLPKGSIPSAYEYNPYLFIDKNGDGIFDEATEQVNAVSGDGSPLGKITESRSLIYTYQYDMSELNGVYPWKIVIKRDGNAAVRGAITGYAANKDITDIYILQIIDGTSPYNLQNMVNDTNSLIYSYTNTSNALDYRFKITTLTKAQFESQYNGTDKKYTLGNLSVNNQLAKYHILILDNSVAISNTDGGSNTTGAADNIKDEIANKMGVIFTKNAVGYVKQLSPGSFVNLRTYNNLNRTASTSSLYIFRNLATYNGALNQTATYNTTYLTKTNEGAITRYPYQINPSIEMATNSYSNDVTIDFNPLVSPMLVGWYCLSDSKSPAIRASFELGGTAAELNQGMYSSSPNDVKNNYYLFSYGACFYSGITMATADEPGNDEEIKLFVNTIIAAYKATDRVLVSPAVIKITDPVPTEAPPEELADTYYFRNVYSGLLMEVTGSSTADSALIQQNTDTYNKNQKFRIVPSDSGYSYIYTGSSDYTKVVDVNQKLTVDGTAIIQYTLNHGSNQQFAIVEVPSGSGKYAIKTRVTASVSCLDNHNSSTDVGSPITQWSYTGVDHQLWYKEPTVADIINVSNTDIKDGIFNLTFDISDSSSNMDMTILLNGAESGSWENTIYNKIGGTAISINNGDKVVSNVTYILKIPDEYVVNNNLLTFTVLNKEGKTTNKHVRIHYTQKPVVAIVDPLPLVNASKGYLYVDIDFNAVDTDEGYLDNQELLVKFSVDKASNYTIDIASEEEDLTDGIGDDVKVYDEADNEVDLTQVCAGGVIKSYTMHIPVALMKGRSSREIVITATAGNIGEASVTLLRRGLFPLD